MHNGLDIHIYGEKEIHNLHGFFIGVYDTKGKKLKHWFSNCVLKNHQLRKFLGFVIRVFTLLQWGGAQKTSFSTSSHDHSKIKFSEPQFEKSQPKN